MSARTEEERRLVAHIRGKSPRNVERRTSLIRAHRESQERHRRAWLENPDVRKELNKRKTVLDQYFTAKAHKNLASTPDNAGEKDANDCSWCQSFREIDTGICINCGKPLK